MRIISKFHDFYDSAMAYGSDPNVVYERHETSLEKCPPLPWNMLPHDGVYRSEFNELWGMVYFCGKVYPYMVAKIEQCGQWPDWTFYWDAESITAAARENGKTAFSRYYFEEKYSRDILDWGGKSYRSTERGVNALFEAASKIDVTSFMTEYKCPVIKIYDEGRQRYFVINPILKILEFYKAVNAFQAYQEIDMFVSGILPQSGRPMVEVSDQVRLEKHGFDEWTFRKKVR